MSDLEELYQELIIDHYKNPRCRGSVDCPNAQCSLLNPLCGDEVKVQLAVREGRIAKVRFTGKGCSISQASASMMSELCEGKSVDEAQELVHCFTLMMRDQIDGDDLVRLGDAASLQGVRRFAARIRCAMLGWEALERCIQSAVSGKKCDSEKHCEAGKSCALADS
ncbi:MAG: SUF system NifU family Fe-S cluster assembly protein [Bdellovibrionales bacterium]|nr:SUF system NifU family Fe-S cluster assembly protein [Bdellovibrionales bacterium]